MRKLVIFAMLASFSFAGATAGEWQKSADFSLNLNQASYSDSWAGGESGSIVWAANANMTAEKALSERYNWRNEMKLSFGQTHSEEEDANGEAYWAKPKKTTDRIFGESLLKMTLDLAVDPFVSLTAESQFYDSSVPEINRFLSPLTLSESVGIGRTIFKTEQKEMMTRLGFSLRQHITRDLVYLDEAGTQLDPDNTETRSTNDGGLEWVSDYNHAFDQMKYVTKLRLFKAFFDSESDDLKGLVEEDYWKSPDLAWENTLSAQVSKYVQVSLFCELIYDKEIDLRGRFRETLGLGLTYKMF